MARLSALLGVALVSALSGAARGAVAADRDWATYANGLSRQAANVGETTLTAANVGGLTQRWASLIGSTGAAILTQPIVAAGIVTPSGTKTLVIAGTESGRLAAFDAATGVEAWHQDTGFATTGCGDLPSGHFGISATPVFSRADRRLYAMGGDGKLHAYDVATGVEAAGWPVTIVADAATEHVYGALALDRGGVFATTASMCDQNTYHGRIVRVQARNPPAVTQAFYPDGSTVRGANVLQYGPGGGGIWGPGGVSIDTSVPTHPLFEATGNLLNSPSEHDRYGDQVVSVSQDLTALDHDYPGLPNPEADVDFGSTPVLYQMLSSCPPSLAAINKNGLLFTYDRTRIGDGPTQRIANDSFTGDVAYDHDRRQLIVTNLDRVEAWRLEPRGCALHLAWSTPESSGPGGELGQAVSPPTVAHGVVYYGNGAGSTLIALDAGTGAQLFSKKLGGAILVAPTVVNGTIFVPAWDGKLYAFGP